MDHRIVGRAVFAFALAASVPSLPATTISFNFGGQSCGSAGSCTAVPGATTISFDSLTVSTPSPYTQGLLTYTWTGSQSPFVQGSVSGQYAAPVGDTTTFLTIGTANKPATVTLSFSTPVYYFGFYMGSPDSYNSISFYDNTTLIRSFTGDQLINPGNGDQSISDYLNFYVSGGAITQIVMSSSKAAFETDSHSYAGMPEPATWGALGLGLGLLALRARRRQ